MSNYPNWVNLDVLKSAMYLDLKDTDASRDNVLVLLGQMITEQMICYMDNPDIDPDEPPMALVRAALKQSTYEWKQRKTPGLQSVQMTDGSINKYQIDEWLSDVKDILNRHRRFALYQTTTTISDYTDPESNYDPSGATGITPPSAPILSSVTSGNTQATATWSPVSDATSYNLYYTAGTTVTKNTGTKLTGVTSAKVVTGLTNAVQYAFAVTSVNANGESALSNIVKATPSA